MAVKLITGPLHYPVTMDQVKDHLSIIRTDTSHDALIRFKLAAAVNKAEQFLKRRLVLQKWAYFLDSWTGDDEAKYFDTGFYIPFGKLYELEQISYWGIDGSEHILDMSNFIVDIHSDQGRVGLAPGRTWPELAPEYPHAVRVMFWCGWFDSNPWQPNTQYYTGDLIVPTYDNGFSYQCQNDGVSGPVEPDWPMEFCSWTVEGEIEWFGIGETTPRPIKQAILLMISDMFENRENTIIGVKAANMQTAESLMYPFRIWEF